MTLPKITVAEQARALVRLLEILERRHRLPAGTLRMEIMIEVNQALLGADGRSPLPGFLAACEGRCTAAHFGTYDFTASCNITAAYQSMAHPMCDLAKGLMILAYAGTGIFLSDGATNVMPVGPHKGDALSPAQLDENRAAVHAAWQLSHRHIRHSLEGGLYQGWDLHPAQLPVRYATCFAFFREGFAPGGRAPAQLRREGGAGDAGRRGLRRRGHRPGPAQLLPARAQLRRDRPRRDRAHRPHARRGRAALVREDPRRATSAPRGLVRR